jgi:hypothetical protein
LGNGITVPKSKAFNLTVNLPPLLGQPLENQAVAAFKMRPQFIVK